METQNLINHEGINEDKILFSKSADKRRQCVYKIPTMKLIFLLAGLLSAVIPSQGKSSNFVIGGRDATIEEFPYMAGVRNLGITYCGGSIINSRTVLTVMRVALM